MENGTFANVTDYPLIGNLSSLRVKVGKVGSEFPSLPVDTERQKQYWQDCTDLIFNAPPPAYSGLYCNRTSDPFSCWPDTPAGTLATISCPDYVINFHPEGVTSRWCMANGTWAPFKRGLYRPCIDTEGTYRAIVTYYVGYTLSIVACTIAFIIFAAFRSLRCPRVTIHQNLFLTYIWTGAFWIAFYAMQGAAPRQGTAIAVGCKVVHVLATYLTLCSYCWMFCEGLYLYMNLVFAFINAKKVLVACIIIGWVTPVPFVVAYAIGMSVAPNPGTCWESPTAVIWLTQGVACATLILNLFFVSHIVYILITKMRDVQTSEQQQIRKVAKAILVLVPLLGLQYLLTPIAPDSQHKFYGLYVIISAAIAATQGLFVASVFCFANGDVLKTLHRKMRSHRYLSRLVRPRKSSADATNVTRYSTMRHQSEVRISANSSWRGAENERPASKSSPVAMATATTNGDTEVTETLIDSPGCTTKS